MNNNRVLDYYVVDTGDWPFRYVPVVRTPYGSLQASTFTFRGAQRWLKRTIKRVEQGMVPA